jgi:hypothetical protein
VVEARLEASLDLPLKVEETPGSLPEESPLAGTLASCYHHGGRMQWQHLNVLNKECVIVCALPQGLRSFDSKAYRGPRLGRGAGNTSPKSSRP